MSFSVFNTKKFWLTYVALCALAFVVAVALSNMFNLGGKDLRDTDLKDTYFAVAFLLMPSAFIPFFALIGFLQKLKRKSA